MECNETSHLVSRPLFTFLLAAEIPLGMAAALSNLALIIALWTSGLFHNNLRILLTHMSAVAIWYSLATGARATYILVARSLDPCRLISSSSFRCKLFEMIAVLPLLSLIYSLIPIGLERLYATIRYRTYERSRTLLVSLVLIAAVWTLSMANQFYSIRSTVVSRNETVEESSRPFCVSVLSSTSSTAAWMLIFGIGQELVALGLYLITYTVNKTLYVNLLINRASDQTLTSRFQLAQNIQVSELMLPTATAHAAFMLPSIGLAALVVVMGLDLEFGLRVELVHLAYLSAIVYALVHPLICFGRNTGLRKSIVAGFHSLRKGKPNAAAASSSVVLRRSTDPKRISQKRRYTHDYQLTTSVSESDRHFDILMRTWEGTMK